MACQDNNFVAFKNFGWLKIVTCSLHVNLYYLDCAVDFKSLFFHYILIFVPILASQQESCQLITPAGTHMLQFGNETTKREWVKMFNSLLRERLGGISGKAIMSSFLSLLIIFLNLYIIYSFFFNRKTC